MTAKAPIPVCSNNLRFSDHKQVENKPITQAKPCKSHWLVNFFLAKITEGLLLISIKGIPDAISAFPELEQLWATVLNQLGYNQDSETATPFQ